MLRLRKLIGPRPDRRIRTACSGPSC